MNKCLVRKFEALADNSNLKKFGELKLKAFAAGTLTLRAYYGDTKVVCVSGQMTYNGSVVSYVDLTQSTSSVYALTCTKDTILAIENKLAIDSLYSSITGGSDACFELTDGYTMEDLYYNKFFNLKLGGESSGSIDGLDVSRIDTINFEGSKVTGSLDIFKDSNVIRYIRIQNTAIGGNLHNLLNKNLDQYCKFENSSLYVDVAEVSQMTTAALQNITLYRNCYLYGDVSSMAASVQSINSQSAEKALQFTWLTTRHTNPDAYTIGNYANNDVAFMDYGTYLDAMLIDQAQCKVGSNKNIQVYGTHTDGSGWESAVATLKSNGYTVKINGVTM